MRKPGWRLEWGGFDVRSSDLRKREVVAWVIVVPCVAQGSLGARNGAEWHQMVPCGGRSDPQGWKGP
ncbi:hypothetical protein GCM10010319_56650 [Streptomyces blastmyceticus]|uniref:Uncharacterized protein n=1 Tax=Streptomyces blastmyceticus TaxID=68180 RepID=A0ABN0XSA4_9ACTN